jgi:methyl-accepting chemotaxis protein WspA
MQNHTLSKIYGFLSRLSYSQKFILISSLFGLSVLISSYYMIKAQNKTIQFAELELKGNLYERILRKLLETIPKHEWLENQYLLGDTSVNGELFNIATDITTNFKYLININKNLQDELQSSVNDFQQRSLPNLEPSDLASKWDDINAQLQTSSPETSLNLHNQLIDNIQKLLLHIGETSNLMLDPSVQANYFMETILYQLPQVQILIPKMIVDVQNLLHKKNSEKNEKTEKIDKENLLIHTSFLQAVVENTKNTLYKAFFNRKDLENIAEVEAKLKVPLSQFLDSSNIFLKYTQEKFLSEGTPKVNESEYLILAGKALDDSFNLWDTVAEQFDKILKTRIEKYKAQQLYSILASLLSALLGLLFGILVMREISRPLTNLVNGAKQLARGDLSTRVPIAYKDEVGQAGIAFNQMAESFQELIGQLQWIGIQLTTSTTEIAAAAKQQEATVVEQEATTKQIAVTANGISSTSKEFAKTMNDLSATAEQTSALATAGKAGLSRMETIMRQMVDASQSIAAKLAILSEKAGNITGVITTITKVADQTNLLSLNAAIEAEKAGEHGRTFAVIAREIRRLADQTGNATLDIEQTVNEIVSAVAAGVMSVDKFSEEIHTGVSQITGASEQLSKIIEQVQQQTSSFEDVNQGMQTQTLGAEQINDSITQLSESAQHTSESIRQFHNAIEQLNRIAQEMQTAVSKIKR